MALIKASPLVADIRGSVGGVTFARNASGAYARARISPVQPQTARQSAVRAALAAAQSYWSDTLTPAARALWETLGAITQRTNAIGEASPLTGAQAFCAVNALRIQAGLDILDDPPTGSLSTPAPGLSVSEAAVTFDVKVDIAGGALAADCALLLAWTNPMRPTRNFWAGPWHNAQPVLTADGAAIDTGLDADDTPYHKIFFKARYLAADGAFSPIVRFEHLCVGV